MIDFLILVGAIVFSILFLMSLIHLASRLDYPHIYQPWSFKKVKPKIGEIWAFRVNPFSDPILYEVLDIKDNYLKYRILGIDKKTNDVIEIDTFIRLYRKEPLKEKTNDSK